VHEKIRNRGVEDSINLELKDIEAISEEVVEELNLSNLEFDAGGNVFVNKRDITNQIREKVISELASKIATFPLVRSKLLKFQREFVNEPGLVTDGRDMGSVVFPEANLKIFLTANINTRASRRFSQLQAIDKSVKISEILEELASRDKRDLERKHAPLKYDGTFKVLDNSNLTIEQTVDQILELAKH
jgi:cytidylate kinase